MLLGVQRDQARQENHGVQEGHDWPKEDQSCEHDYCCSKLGPCVIYLIRVHERFHPVLLLVKLIKGLEVVAVEGHPSLLIFVDEVGVVLEQKIRNKCHHDGGDQVNDGGCDQLRGDIKIAIINPILNIDYYCPSEVLTRHTLAVFK